MAEYVNNAWTSKLVDVSLLDDKYSLRKGLIFYKNRIFIVPESKLKEGLIHSLHDAPLIGHPGFFKTYKLVRDRFPWKGLKNDILKNVRECQVCQTNKTENTLPVGLLQP